MTNHEGDTSTDELFRRCDRLVGVARVVNYEHLDPLAKYPAFGVEVRDRALGADLVAGSSPSHMAGQRRSQTDQNLGPSGARAECRNQGNTDVYSPADHGGPGHSPDIGKPAYARTWPAAMTDGVKEPAPGAAGWGSGRAA